MVTRSENELMTRIGRDTPAGDLLRRYWHPVCPAADLTAEKPVRRVRMLGEDLVLFRDLSGRVGLVPEQCPHRRASLYYGFIEEDGLRCAYHGWKFDAEGNCVERPFEPQEKAATRKICHGGYRVERLAGLYWAYLGPQPAPLLPRWDIMVRRDGPLTIHVMPDVACNWLQVMENSVDSTHTYYLHGLMMIKHGLPHIGAYYAKPFEACDFEVCREATWAGVRKVRIYGEDRERGHPLIFPCILLVPAEGHIYMHFRVPIDDCNTRILRLRFTPGGDTSGMDWENPKIIIEPPYRNAEGEFVMNTFASQDAMAWETQGAILDRTQEMLGASDRGVALYRRMLREEIDAVRDGRDPAGVLRDAAMNERIVIALSEGQVKDAPKMNAAMKAAE